MKKHRISERAEPANQSATSPVVGTTWYTEHEWAKVKATATDPERFENTFVEWLAMAEEAINKLQSSRIVPVKVLITSNDLLAWCLLHKKQNNAAARAQFV